MEEIKIEMIKEFIINRFNKKYYIYMLEKDNAYEFYLQEEVNGIISLMFGLPKEQQTINKAIEICNSNLEEYINMYNEEFIEEEM